MARLLWLGVLLWGLGHAQDDPVVTQRLKTLSAELRCLVCQNQSLADSNAELAVDLRNQVREQIAAGKSDAEIKEYMVARYGDFVLYRPPVKGTTWLLWAGPFVLLMAAAVGMAVYVRRRRARTQQAPLSAEESRRAREILGEGARASEDAPS